jgi:hypothetical protein
MDDSLQGIAGGKMGVSVCCMLVLQFSPVIHSISAAYCTSHNHHNHIHYNHHQVQLVHLLHSTYFVVGIKVFNIQCVLHP